MQTSDYLWAFDSQLSWLSRQIDRVRPVVSRMLMALGVAAPLLAWYLVNSVPASCYDLWSSGNEYAAFCNILWPTAPLFEAGLVAVGAFIVFSWGTRTGGGRCR